MDFFDIKTKKEKNKIVIYPNFKVCRSMDLMVKGKSFYAIWDEEKNLWSTDEYDVQKIVDKELKEYTNKILEKENDGKVVTNYMGDFSTNSWKEFRKYLQNISDNAKQLDANVVFADMNTNKKSYASKKLEYSLDKISEPKAYNELIGKLYEPEEKDKIEWAIGSILHGDSKYIQKFIVLYGDSGAGKSTVLHIIEKLFKGYTTNFEAKDLVGNNNTFSTSVFKDNPLVAIQHDGDLSKIEDNTKINSIVSHEDMIINEKYKSGYTTRINCFLFMATNKPVKITDSKSGIIRRLIDVKPSGKTFPIKKYQALVSQIDFELGAIANQCLEKYLEYGKNYYNNYVPIDMLYKTDMFFNFVENSFDVFNTEDGISLKAAYTMYKDYCEESGTNKMPMYRFREELKNYFKKFEEVAIIDNERIRSYYTGFITKKFDKKTKYEKQNNEHENNMILDCKESLLDEMLKDYPAQYANEEETPSYKWDKCYTKLKDINTKKLHYVKVPENHIVIDFDIKDDKGNKSLEKNLEAASKWPPTYAEFSKSKCGIHLHYIYDGDVSRLSRVYDDNIEIKVFSGNSSLRRKLSLCNNISVAHISSGLPLKKEKKMINNDAVKNEKNLRALIEKNLRKEIHPGTKPSIDFIYKILEDAYDSGLTYDIIDMKNRILAFANNSTHHAEYCVKLVAKMKFSSDQLSSNIDGYKQKDIVFFDVEVFPNVNMVCFMNEKAKTVSKMINPTPSEIGELLNFKLVGFNCRRYDNHILYAILIGKPPEEVFKISQGIINGNRTAFFGNAWNISYADIYDFSSKKQSLKKFEIELGLHHKENSYPWDKPLPKDKWEEVADYCCNDVLATKATFIDRKEDFAARQMLAEISGLSVNDTTQSHTAKIIFGEDPNPQDKFIYTDLSEEFPGYTFSNGVSLYMGENPSEGGYVYAEPGMYNNVALLDIASLHPTSLIKLNLFGDKYTKNFKQLLDARLAIKHKEYDKVRKMMNGAFEKYLGSEENSKQLSYALKIIINSVYGYTSAKFDNKFKDIRNVDNIVAKRGALFMITLKNEVQKRGYTVAHIKTDSIKIPNADDKIIKFIIDFGKKYGYTFEHEATYKKLCLVNDAVYIAKYNDGKHKFELSTGEVLDTEWTATGTEFQVPYVFKTLFSKDRIVFRDLCEIKSVTSSLYLDFNENLGENEHQYHFVGKIGLFCPMKDGINAALLLREKDGKYYAVTGTKGYRWMESSVVKELKLEKDINKDYYNTLVTDAVKHISGFGDFEKFIN
ncbi:MAG: hypothetical protein IJ094_12845 [Bacilli bacterium]|nr:hypothetical protein [Bacilli bacterium]